MALFGGIKIPFKPDLENVRRLDALCIPQILDMQRTGLGFSPERSRDLTDKFEAVKDDLRRQIHAFIPPDKLEMFVTVSDDNLNVDSAEQIGKLLFDILGVGLHKRLKKTKSGDRISTGKKQLEALKRDHAIIPKILEYRECSKLIATYTSKFPKIARWHPGATIQHPQCPLCSRTHNVGHWRVHGEIVTTRTSTGRLAHRNPNLANCPARTSRGREVRALFEAQPGYQMISCDYAQIELRLLAHCAKEKEMSRIFHTGGDIHMDTACRAFDLDLAHYSRLSAKKEANTLKDPAEKADWAKFSLNYRSPSKTTNFLIVFAGGDMALFDTLIVNFALAGMEPPSWLTETWCTNFMHKWHSLYPDVKPYLEHIWYLARKYGIAWTEFGFVRRIPEVRSSHERVIQAGLRQASNVPIQGLAAGINKIGMARTQQTLVDLRESGIDVWPLMSIHDELLFEAPDDWAELLEPKFARQMRLAVNDTVTGESFCDVPIGADGKISREWRKD